MLNGLISMGNDKEEESSAKMEAFLLWESGRGLFLRLHPRLASPLGGEMMASERLSGITWGNAIFS